MRKKLKELRLKKGFTHDEMAREAGITRSHYTKIENGMGNPSLHVAIKLKDVVGYFNDDLFLCV